MYIGNIYINTVRIYENILDGYFIHDLSMMCPNICVKNFSIYNGILYKSI